jgi:hypothetical protein
VINAIQPEDKLSRSRGKHEGEPSTEVCDRAAEYLKRYEANLARMPEVRARRSRESDAGRPSGLKDYFVAHGFCSFCHGVGLAMNNDGMGYKAVGWDGDKQLFEECDFCAAPER